MLKANYHTHCVLCGHATGWPIDYIKWAVDHYFEVIGISDHCFIPKEFMSKEDYSHNWLERQMSEKEFYEIYLTNISEAIDQYGDIIKIYSAVEVEYLYNRDYFYLKLLEVLDYLNLGMHYFQDYNGTIYNSYEYMDKDLLKKYVSNTIDALNTKYFKILVHPDLFMFNYHSINGKLIFDEYCEKATRDIIEAAIKNDVILEVNCGGLKNGIKNVNGAKEFLYPRSEFWEIAKGYKGLKIVIGADAHKPEELTCNNIKTIEDFCEKIGLNVLSKAF